MSPYLALIVVASLAGVLLISPALARGGRDGWKAGVARVKITPEQSMWMGGYGFRDHPSEGTLTDLWAKALVLEDANGTRSVLITLDLIGVTREVTESVSESLLKRCGLERSHVAICASHTHSGPALRGNLGPVHELVVDATQRKLIQDYTAALPEKLIQAAEEAVRDLKPVRLSWGSGIATFAVNRRRNPEKEVPQLRAQGKLQGPVDHDVPVLAIRDSAGELRAVVFGYACHATTNGLMKWYGDYPGYAQANIEELHPGCQAMFWAGCGADQNPLPRWSVELALEYGRQLAAGVEAVLAQPMEPISPRLAVDFQEIPLPYAALPTREKLEHEAKSENRSTAAWAAMLLEQMAGNQSLPSTYPYPVQSWRLGDEVRFIMLGGEVVVDYAVRLKAELGGRRTWVAGYAGDVMGYIPSRRVLQEGGYEGGGATAIYGLPAGWTPEIEDLIVKEASRQLVGKLDTR